MRPEGRVAVALVGRSDLGSGWYVRGSSFSRGGLAFAWGRGEDLEEELFIQEGLVALDGGSQELVAVVHEDTEVGGSVLDECDLEFGRDQLGVACSSQQVVETCTEFVGRGVLELQVAADATLNGLQVAVAQPLRQAGVASEDDAEQGPGIEVLAGQNPDLVEDGSEHLLGLIDDEERAHEGGGDVLGPALPQSLKAVESIVVLGGDAEEVADLAIEIGDPALGMIDGADGDVGLLAEAVGEQTQSDALSGAGVADKKDVAPLLGGFSDDVDGFVLAQYLVYYFVGYFDFCRTLELVFSHVSEKITLF